MAAVSPMAGRFVTPSGWRLIGHDVSAGLHSPACGHNPRRYRSEEKNVSIADAVAAASAYLTEHPDEARYRDSLAHARLASGLAVTVSGPGGESLQTDMPAGIGGSASAPSPGWILRAAAASCVVSLIAIRAAATGIQLRTVDVDVDSESDDRGILGLDAAIPAGPLSTKVVVAIDAPGSSRDAIEALAAWAVEHCPVTDAISRPVALALEVR
jgi:uncharacterized OsmC-like protein